MTPRRWRARQTANGRPDTDADPLSRHAGVGLSRSPTFVPAPTSHETLTRLLLLPVLPGLEPQVRLRDSRGLVVARFDLGGRERKLAVESDGKRAHAGAVMVAKHRRRDDLTARHGWWTERVTWYDVRRLPDQTTARVLRRAAALDAHRAV